MFILVVTIYALYNILTQRSSNQTIIIPKPIIGINPESEKIMNYKKMQSNLKNLIINPTPRVAIGLCLDTSWSMYGRRMDELNRGVHQLLHEIDQDDLTRSSAEISIVTFDSTVQCITDFNTVDQLQPPTLQANGNTYMGEGLVEMLEQLEKRKNQYKAAGVDYYQPILVLMSDGKPNGDKQVLETVTRHIQQLRDQRKLSVIAVGIDQDADMEILRRIGGNKTFHLQGLQFREFFAWLSQSVSSVSASMPGNEPDFNLEALKKLESQPWPDESL